MHAALKKATPFAVLMLAAATLTGCVLAPAEPYSGGEYYAEPAPVYVAPPRYYYGGSRWSTWHRNRWHGGWSGGNHHWD
jgi:hypothetical protein